MDAAASPENALLIDTSAEIDAPIATVWEVLADLASYRSWNPFIVQVDGRPEPGEVLTVSAVVESLGEITYPVDVVAVEAPGHMRWEGGYPDRSTFKGDHHWDLKSLDEERTSLRHWEVLSGSLRPQVVPDAAVLTANFDVFNAALKAEAERRFTSDD